jgi:yecA family protein
MQVNESVRAMSDEILNQLECFKAYLLSGRAPRWTMGPADIHGFLTGLAIAGPLPEEEWLPWIFSGEKPQFESEEEAWNVMCDLIDFEEQVRCSIGSYRILAAPLLPYAGNGQFSAADWAEGLMQAIAVNPGPWQKAVDAAEQSLAVVLAACYDNHDNENRGLITLDGLDELNYHLRHLARIMQTAATPLMLPARAA